MQESSGGRSAKELIEKNRTYQNVVGCLNQVKNYCKGNYFS